MGLMEFLFPSVELARREALARINAMRNQMDEIDAIEKPIRDLAGDVLPLLRDIELAGWRPETILVPHDRLKEVRLAGLHAAMLRGTPFGGHPGVDRLFGIPVTEGTELTVVAETP